MQCPDGLSGLLGGKIIKHDQAGERSAFFAGQPLESPCRSDGSLRTANLNLHERCAFALRPNPLESLGRSFQLGRAEQPEVFIFNYNSISERQTVRSPPTQMDGALIERAP